MEDLHIVIHHRHGDPQAAYAALCGLAERYPETRFGLLKSGGGWLVYRVHEQKQKQQQQHAKGALQ